MQRKASNLTLDHSHSYITCQAYNVTLDHSHSNRTWQASMRIQIVFHMCISVLVFMEHCSFHKTNKKCHERMYTMCYSQVRVRLTLSSNTGKVSCSYLLKLIHQEKQNWRRRKLYKGPSIGKKVQATRLRTLQRPKKRLKLSSIGFNLSQTPFVIENKVSR